VSQALEIELCREADPQIRAQMGLVDNEELQGYVSDLGMRLARVSERPDLPWAFHVVDDPLVNAFALPGGFIYVTRGILAHFDSEAELAGVLGHEIGHVTARHSVSQMSRQRLQQIGLGVGMVVSETVRDFGGLVGAGIQLLNLSYSRGDESESDVLGLRYITEMGYDPEAMIGVFDMLSRASGGRAAEIPEWQATHPHPENRAENMRREIATQGLPREGTVGRDVYLDRIDGMVYGSDPRQGYFKSSRFLHPEMAFEMSFPSGWTTINRRTVVAAVAPEQEAVLTLQVAPEVSDPAEGVRAFLAQEGVSGGPVRETGGGDIERTQAPFQVVQGNTTLRGEVALVRLEDTTYALVGYGGTGPLWDRHAESVLRAMGSFRRLTDPEVLAVEPWRLDIRTLDEATSLERYASTNPTPVDLEALATLNRVTLREVLDAGARIKWVAGEPLP